MRSMTIFVLALLLAIPLGASAQEEEPLVIEVFTNEDGARLIESEAVPGYDGLIRYSMVGYFVWLEWGDPDREADSHSENMVSVDVSDPTIVKVRAYEDGTVELVREQPEPDTPEPQPQPEPVEESETVDLVRRYPEIEWGKILPGGIRVE